MKKNFIIYLILISLLLIIPITLSLASISTDKPSYNKLDTVYIIGNGFTPGAIIGVQVNDSTGAKMWANTTDSNSSGQFTNKYIIPENANTGTWTVYAKEVGGNPVTATFQVSPDTQSPQWSSMEQIPTVVTILDDVKINVTWYDNVNLNKVIYWENSTGGWQPHVV